MSKYVLQLFKGDSLSAGRICHMLLRDEEKRRAAEDAERQRLAAAEAKRVEHAMAAAGASERQRLAAEQAAASKRAAEEEAKLKRERAEADKRTKEAAAAQRARAVAARAEGGGGGGGEAGRAPLRKGRTARLLATTSAAGGSTNHAGVGKTFIPAKVKKDTNFSAPISRDKNGLGIGVDQVDGEARIGTVEPGGAASKQTPIRMGDVL